MKITFLEAKERLTKSFSLDQAGQLIKQAYPNAYEFKSHSHDIKSLKDFEIHLKIHANQYHCLLKGEIQRPLDWESRAGSTSALTPTQWLLIDLDGLKSVPDVEDFMTRIGMSDVSYIVQYSSSMGVDPSKGLSAHIVVMLDKPASPAFLKLWLTHLNLSLFKNDLELTKTNMALRWVVDITTCQNDKLIYVAPPVCIPASLDQFQGARIQLILKTHLTTSISQSNVPTAETLKQQSEDLVNSLRKAKNLPEKKKFTYKIADSVQYMSNPDKATVTSTRLERGFVYLNLNGGDSYAYYHPENNPTYIYNFKGEPTYLTKELVPDYWAEVAQSAQPIQAQAKHARAGRVFLAFRDFRTSTYYNGWLDTASNELTISSARNEKQLKDFLKQYGQPVPDHVVDMDLIYDPSTTTVLDLNARTVNTFRPSIYMQIPVSKKPPALPLPVPPIVDKIVTNVLGNDLGLISYFHNWVAFVFRHRRPAGTAMILQGIQGTGKGILFNRILEPLLGKQNVEMKRMEELEEKYNGHLENALLCVIDEAQINDSARSKTIMANLKNFITEPTITIRRMREQAYQVKNHCSWMFNSNVNDSVVLEPTDRRFSVSEYRREPLLITDAELDQLDKEIADYARFLNSLKIDTDAVRKPYDNESRNDLINNSMSSLDRVAKCIISGDLEKLWEWLPDSVDALDITTAMRVKAYRSLLEDLVRTKRLVLSRDELQVIFLANVGHTIPITPAKFAQFLGHYNIAVKTQSINGKSIRGYKVGFWKPTDAWFEERKAEMPDNKMKLVVNNDEPVQLKETQAK